MRAAVLEGGRRSAPGWVCLPGGVGDVTGRAADDLHAPFSTVFRFPGNPWSRAVAANRPAGSISPFRQKVSCQVSGPRDRSGRTRGTRRLEHQLLLRDSEEDLRGREHVIPVHSTVEQGRPRRPSTLWREWTWGS